MKLSSGSTSQREETINRWSKAGLLEGLTPDYKENIVKLFESQSSFIINEPNNDELLREKREKLFEEWCESGESNNCYPHIIQILKKIEGIDLI